MSSKLERAAVIQGIRQAYEEDIGMKLDLVSRLHDNVEHRVALAMAMIPYAIKIRCGELGKHHATISHYVKEHQPMMEYYPSYVVKYVNAVRIAEIVSEATGVLPMTNNYEMSLESQISTYRASVVMLQRKSKKWRPSLQQENLLTKFALNSIQFYMSNYKFKTTNIRGKQYVEVNERIKFFRQETKYDGRGIHTDINMLDGSQCLCKCTITNCDGR